MPKASIKFLGGIENDKNTQEYISLTGSSTLVKFHSKLKNVSVLVDYGMFQGGQIDNQKNKIVDKQALESDFIVLTHAHLDHSGRIPLLVKNGYNNPIYMTELTKLQIVEMLNDYVKIMKEEILLAKSNNTKFRKKVKDDLFLVEVFEKLKTKISKEDRIKYNNKLNKKFGDQNYQNLYNNAKKELDELNIKNVEDIEKYLSHEPELLFEEEDILKMLGLVRILETDGKEINLHDFLYIDKLTDETTDFLLERIKQGYDKTIFAHPKIHNKIFQKLDEKTTEVKYLTQQNEKIDRKNNELVEKLQESLELVGILEQSNNKNEFYNKYKKILDNYGVQNEDDIEDVLEKQYNIEYSLEILEKAKKQIVGKLRTKEDENKGYIDSIKMKFLDAGHIEGSVQVLISIVVDKVEDIIKSKRNNGFLRKNREFKNFLFSGDLGRIRDSNLAGQPEISHYKMDYLQLESTYAGRTHIEKEQSNKDFFEVIESANGKIIIPAFSMQRTQEILINIIEMMQSHSGDNETLQINKRELNILRNNYKNQNNQNSSQAKSILSRIKIIENDIINLKKSPYFYNLVLDTPLGVKISNIYINYKGEKYNLLREEVQEELFGRKIIEFINTKEGQELIYEEKRKNKKEIIVSASGMCNGGSVLHHLKQNLQNKNSTIIFVGYCPENVRGGKIKKGHPVKIENEFYKIDCRVFDIGGFSAHIDQQDLVDYLEKTNLSRNANIVFNHGGEDREQLDEIIKSGITNIKRRINTIIPKLNDEIEINL